MPHHNTDRTWEIYKCGSYCNAINSNSSCTLFVDDIFAECISAKAHCDCRPAWKQPIIWIVAGTFASVFILMIRNFVVRMMNRHERIGRRTVVAQPIVSTINAGLQGDYGNSYNTQPAQPCVVAAPIQQMPMPQWNSTESSQPPPAPPPYSYSYRM